MTTIINPTLLKMAADNLRTLAKQAFIPSPEAMQQAGPPVAPAAPPVDPSTAGMAPPGAGMPPSPGGAPPGMDISAALQSMGLQPPVSDSPISLTTDQLVKLIQAVTGKGGEVEKMKLKQIETENRQMKGILGIPDLSQAPAGQDPSQGAGGAPGIPAMPTAAPTMNMGGGLPSAPATKSSSALDLLRRIRSVAAS